ncbi:MAG: MerR family transcriptional regulator [Kofleriaceae bacterium]|nr:MerR family transcriptional regulator [Kofleriaceae bacterium]
METPLWTLRELAAEVADQLARNYQAADNGQVRPIPDQRSIRYYTTLGLIDRPAAMRGRTALYGHRHLAQLVAIKRLQAAGRSLADIQALLATLDDATLSRISGVVLPRAARPRTQRADFWRAAEAAPAAADDAGAAAAVEDAAAVTTDPDDDDVVVDAAPVAAAPALAPAYTFAIAPGVTVLLQPRRAPDPDDAAALARAAAPLLAELARRGLLPDPDRPHVAAGDA